MQIQVPATRRFLSLALVALGLVAPGCDSGSTTTTDAAVFSDAAVVSDAAVGSDAFVDQDANPGSDAGPETLAIIGSYTDDFGGSHDITADTWTLGYEGSAPSLFHITRFDNAAGWLVAQNDAANEFSPGLFSRFEWVEAEGSLYFCQSPYDAETESAAIEAPASDRTDPANSGCGGTFPWSQLIAR